MNAFCLLLLSVLIGSSSQLMLKAGMNKIGAFSFTVANIWPITLQIACNPYIIIGTIGFAISMAVWLLVLSRMEISVAYPMVSIGYIITSLAAYYLFQESLTPTRIAGIAVIIFGVFLVSQSA